MLRYGAFHVWGRGDRVEVSGCPTQEEAFDSVARMLRMSNWTLPRWWHFWRWDEDIPLWLRERFLKQ